MKHIHITLKSNYDDLNIEGLIIQSDKIKAIVQINHGICEHKERYIPFMEYLAKEGYLCVIHDHRGHGKSIKKLNDLGYFYDGKNRGLVEDIELINQYIKQKYPNIPIYLFGHSMGSLAVRAYIKKYDNHINGLFVCGSPSSNSMIDAGLVLVRILSRIKGPYYKNKLVDNMVIGAFNKPFKKEKIANAWLSTNINNVIDYNNDPLCGFSFTMNGYESLLSLMKDVYSKENWTIQNKDLPIHFISGEYDPCMTNQKMFFQAINHLSNIGYNNITNKLYKSMRHEILNETNKVIVYQDIMTTIKKWEK